MSRWGRCFEDVQGKHANETQGLVTLDAVAEEMKSDRSKFMSEPASERSRRLTHMILPYLVSSEAETRSFVFACILGS